jgi:hypothetical protein
VVPPIAELVLVNQPIKADNFGFLLLSEKVAVHCFVDDAETERRGEVYSLSDIETV